MPWGHLALSFPLLECRASALPGFETNSWREQRAPPYRESPRLSQFPPSAPGHPSQTSLMAGGIAGAGGEFPSVLGVAFFTQR